MLKVVILKLTFVATKVSHSILNFLAKKLLYSQSLGLQLVNKLLGPDTTSQGSLHEGSKCHHCQEKPKWLSKPRERPVNMLNLQVVKKLIVKNQIHP